MKVFIIIIAIIGIALIITVFINNSLRESEKLLKRNDEVYKFLIYINQVLCHEYIMRRLENNDTDWKWPQIWFLGKYKYEEFVYSDKPLILEEWWTEEEINKLMS